MVNLKVYKTDPSVTIPKFGTENAACFDLSYCPYGKTTVKIYSNWDRETDVAIDPETGKIRIEPWHRALVPTGLIFDIPVGYSVRIHPRSGMSLKYGITLFNCTGVIDADYFHETFITVLNISDVPFVISPGDRIAQGELIKLLNYEVVETEFKPAQKTDRTGGFGSTG
jgi:dUTP pyrophosphatase